MPRDQDADNAEGLEANSRMSSFHNHVSETAKSKIEQRRRSLSTRFPNSSLIGIGIVAFKAVGHCATCSQPQLEAVKGQATLCQRRRAHTRLDPSVERRRRRSPPFKLSLSSVNSDWPAAAVAGYRPTDSDRAPPHGHGGHNAGDVGMRT
ncbi:hypothetical protein K438DRAFT_1750257 [Mycena galopus ATCC 62051]|nr:hypothetical protein K438DRAFT_1750257 [Mycena galopus ATCC 62051]